MNATPRIFCCLALALTTGAAAAEPVPPGYRQVARETGVPPRLLYAIGLTESGRRVEIDGRSVLRPWPWTLNVGGKGLYFPTRAQATETLEALYDQGRRSIDIGLMQVNWRYHRSRLADRRQALDPYFNLRVAARILRECHEATHDWWQAVGCYHSPGKGKAARKRAERYRARVRRHWRGLDG